jgi:hypothetical protein
MMQAWANHLEELGLHVPPDAKEDAVLQRRLRTAS